MFAQSIDRWTWGWQILLCGLTILLVVSLSHVAGAERQADKQSDAAKLVSWPLPVCIARDADAEIKRIAEDLATRLFNQPSVMTMSRNPVCCLWLEVTRWTPNPGVPGYVINLQGGGGWVQASDVEQLKLAVEQLKKSVVMKDGMPHLPLGLRTNYPLAPAQ